jgi:hypothetical protein
MQAETIGDATQYNEALGFLEQMLTILIDKFVHPERF